MSFKVDIRGEKRFRGMEEFSIQQPVIRNYTIEALAAKALAKSGKELAYDNSRLAQGLDKFASAFRFRGRKPIEVAEAKKTQKAREMRDVNFAEEKVARIDQEVDKVFPEFRKVFNSTD